MSTEVAEREPDVFEEAPGAGALAEGLVRAVTELASRAAMAEAREKKAVEQLNQFKQLTREAFGIAEAFRDLHDQTVTAHQSLSQALRKAIGS